MFTTDRSLLCCTSISCFISNRNGRTKSYLTPPILANKKDFSQISTEEEKAISPFKLSNTRSLIQSALGVFTLGFIDAGYSGDWSRIGVISSGTEDLLKAAAFLVVPFCFFLIFSLSKKDHEK